jgi:hypothetical protein
MNKQKTALVDEIHQQEPQNFSQLFVKLG